MIKIAVGGTCQSCGRYSPVLYTCKSCGARVCPACINTTTGFCKLCRGIKRVKGGKPGKNIRK